MPVCKAITQKDGVYFITFTCLPAGKPALIGFPFLKSAMLITLFIIGSIILKSRDIILSVMSLCQNHVHAVIAFSNTGKTINTVVSKGKRFIAYDLVKQLREMKSNLILNELSNDLNTTEKKEGKIYGVFETSFDWKECRTEKFMQQKLAYIHWNPCKGNKLVETPEQYVHSSAKFYIEGEQGIYPVTSFMELRDIDLTKPL